MYCMSLLVLTTGGCGELALLFGQCVQPNPVQNVLYEPAGAVVGEAVVSRGGGG